MEGKIFGRWKVLHQIKVKQGRTSVFKYYLCRCECGVEKPVRSVDLRHGRSTQCQDCRKKSMYYDIQEFIGMKQGKLTVIAEATQTKTQQQRLKCQCECGKIYDVVVSRFVKSKPQSCHLCNVTKHGYDNTPTHFTWRTMHARCSNPKHHNFKHYGARGVSVCERWKKFENFLEDMGEKPKGHQIDPINNNGNYEPTNCRWVTPKINSNNRRNSKPTEPIQQS